jgi:hypothetical protein
LAPLILQESFLRRSRVSKSFAEQIQRLPIAQHVLPQDAADLEKRLTKVNARIDDLAEKLADKVAIMGRHVASSPARNALTHRFMRAVETMLSRRGFARHETISAGVEIGHVRCLKSSIVRNASFCSCVDVLNQTMACRASEIASFASLLEKLPLWG